jgi:hypothetical protein
LAEVEAQSLLVMNLMKLRDGVGEVLTSRRQRHR